VSALEKLLEETECDAKTLDDLQAAFSEGLEHAEHCGTLISRLAAMDEAGQREALDELVRLRTSGLTWTQLKKDA
jgi:hypothetical protein